MGKKNKRRSRKIKAEPGPENLAARAAGIVTTLRPVEILGNLLDTAINLWFADKSPVSVQVLVCAAHSSLYGLGKETGTGPTLKSHVKDDVLYAAYDHFHHVSRGDFDFAPITNESLMLDAVVSFDKTFGFRTAYMSTFGAYLNLQNLEALKSGGPDEPFYEGLLMKDVRDLSRQDFFALMVPLYGQRETGFFHSGKLS